MYGSAPAWSYLADRLGAAVGDAADQQPAAAALPGAEAEKPSSGSEAAAQQPSAAAVAAGADGLVEQLLLWSQAIKAEHEAWAEAAKDGERTPAI